MNQNPYNNQFNNYYPQQHGVYYQPQLTPAQIQQQQRQAQMIHEHQSKEKKQILTAGFALGITLIVNLMVQVIGVSLIQSMGKYDLFQNSFIYQHSINILLVDVCSLVVPFLVLSLMFRSRFKTPVVPCEKIGFIKCASWVFVGLAVCLGANILTNGVIEIFKQFGYELTKTEALKPNSPVECILLIFSTAVAPAICEEFSMRCVSLGLLRKHGKAFAVVAVSIVFGLLHGNVIQFVFAFTIGLILGYVTIVTDSVVPAMFIHGFNNGLSVMQDIFKYATDEKTANIATGVCTIGILLFGVLGLVYLIVKKQLVPKKEPELAEPYRVNFFVRLALLAPGLFVPFLILIYLTSKTIVPIS
ncbi:MAG: CPBP family intramembrane metalloprotease [Eubacterium sp.]|nr:CPBP family intramembrane metalloprotease [Eubacterium sp.]